METILPILIAMGVSTVLAKVFDVWDNAKDRRQQASLLGLQRQQQLQDQAAQRKYQEDYLKYLQKETEDARARRPKEMLTEAMMQKAVGSDSTQQTAQMAAASSAMTPQLLGGSAMGQDALMAILNGSNMQMR